MAVLALELALFDPWISWGLKPTVVIGHSVGEYAALSVAQVISRADMFFLIVKRMELLEARCIISTHGMLAAPLPNGDLQHIMNNAEIGSCEIACLNSPSSNTITGPSLE